MGIRLPIGEEELGAHYENKKDSAFFFPIQGAYYNNHMKNTHPNAIISTYAEFKEKYPICIYSNYYKKSNKNS